MEARTTFPTITTGRRGAVERPADRHQHGRALEGAAAIALAATVLITAAAGLLGGDRTTPRTDPGPQPTPAPGLALLASLQ